MRALWLAERSVCMRVCKHGCDVKMFCFSRANHASTNLKTFLSSKLDKFAIFTYSFVSWNLEHLYKQAVSILFSLKLKIRILESILLQNKNWLRVQVFVYTTLRLVRISLLISAITKSFAFFSGKLFYKSNRKLFSCFCKAWYKHSTVMQTLDFVSGLHNCLEFSQPLECLYQAMQTRKTFSIA